ncbi:uncharacterized protein LOC135714793, partial [Ochlerotatus camptorhynchus]|uniref:uncharacterized protein LOC135714793 n=1 Tax=Ochlerotatus camptorhynchus TaxID=644619 RepID=UPI0031E46D2A
MQWKKKIKIDESSSFICQRCYHKLYEPNDAVTEEAVAGPSRIAATESIEATSIESISVAGPPRMVPFPCQESVETTSSESIVTTYNAPLSDENEFLIQLKDKYQETRDSNERYRILTTLPKSWSTYRIMKEFNVSQHMANQAKALQQEKGIMSVPVKRLSRASLGEPTIMLVRDFYNSDDISRVWPGKRDYLISKNDEGKIYVQRRLVLCNLQEAYSIFKNTYPDIKIGFSMFASNRPKHCILAGTSGTHTVCVCIYHQNVKLIFKTLQSRQSLPDGVDSYHDLFKKIICQNPSEQCWLQCCKICSGTQILATELMTILSNGHVESIQFKQWRQVERCIMDLVEMDTQEFIDTFLEKIFNLLPHNFIAEQQANYMKHVKSNLKATECIIIGDFSENYSFVVQDAVQGFHWANAQCTIHPCAIYFKDEESNDLKFTSFIAIADFTKHNHIAVRLFLTHCLAFIKCKLPSLQQIYFFSDGSGSQYKNKMTAFNLCYMQKDFGIAAEWNFFATCHGKGPCDALGGVLKRNAAKA